MKFIIKMDKIEYKPYSEIGKYNIEEDSYFDLTPYNNYSPINSIILYLDEQKTCINGIEIFYNKITTGIFHSNLVKINNQSKIVINFAENETIDFLTGSFIGNRITKLIFHTSLGKENGYNNEKDYNILKLHHFIIKSEQAIAGFKFSFSSQLTYLCPIYNQKSELQRLYKYDKEKNIYITDIKMGKTFNDSVLFSFPLDFIDTNFFISQVTIYHDGNLLFGIGTTYLIGGKQIKTMFGNKTKMSDTLVLGKSEVINDIRIRSGDMIDGIIIQTNLKNVVIGGGLGGGPHSFNIKDISPKAKFVGFEGYFGKNSCMHLIRIIFK